MGAGALPTTCLSNYTPRPCVVGVLLVFTSTFPETWSGCLSGSRIVSGRVGYLGRSVQRLVETLGVEEHSFNVLLVSRPYLHYSYQDLLPITSLFFGFFYSTGSNLHCHCFAARTNFLRKRAKILLRVSGSHFARPSHLPRTLSQVRQSCHVINPCDVITRVTQGTFLATNHVSRLPSHALDFIPARLPSVHSLTLLASITL